MESVERIHEEMHGDPNIFSEAYVAATLREAKRDRAFYRAYFEKFGTAELEKGYQTLFENVFKPFFRRLGIESEHCMEYHFEFVKAGCHPFAASSFATSIPMPDVAPITIAFFAI